MEDIPPSKPLLARQFSSPLPSNRGLFPVSRQTSVPNEHEIPRNASEGDNAAQTGHDEGPNSSGVTAKRSTLSRMKVLGSIRTTRLNGAASNSDSAKDPTRNIPEDFSDSNMEEPTLSGEELRQVMDRAIRYFNLNPKVALKFLKEKRVTYSKKDSPEVNARRAALFLKNTRGLNKVKIGLFLCGDSLILGEYMATFDFTTYDATVLGVEAGLRDLLTYFKPPGEGQQIDRILECFAARFAIHSEPKLSKDNVHQIAFLIIVLNVTLHHPRVRASARQSKEEFVSTFVKEESLKTCGSREELLTLYDNVARAEIKHVDDRDDLAGNLFSDPDMSGWLDIKMMSTTSAFPSLQARWKKRWVILSQNVLYYFKRSTDVDFEGFITLENLRLLTEPNTPTPDSGRALLRSFPSSSTFGSGLLYGLSTPNLSTLREEQSQPAINTTETSIPRMSRLISCSAFKTSQSSLNSSGNTSSTAFSSTSKPSGWSFLGRNQLEPFSAFLLAPVDPKYYVKSARLSKTRRSKTGGGKVTAEQYVYVAFRTRSKPEFDLWVRKLRQNGIVRGRAALSFYESISSKRYWGGRSGASKFKLLSPAYSLPVSFSQDEVAVEERDILQEGRASAATEETVPSLAPTNPGNGRGVHKAPVMNEVLALA